MVIDLTEKQQEAIAEAKGPPRVRDPRTNTEYMLVPVSDFQAYLDLIDNDPDEIAWRRAALRTMAKRLEEDDA